MLEVERWTLEVRSGPPSTISHEPSTILSHPVEILPGYDVTYMRMAGDDPPMWGR
jgi:hypothetical protein